MEEIKYISAFCWTCISNRLTLSVRGKAKYNHPSYRWRWKMVKWDFYIANFIPVFSLPGHLLFNIFSFDSWNYSYSMDWIPPKRREPI